MKNKHDVHQSAEKFKSDVKAIEMEKNTKIQGFFNRIFNNQMARPMARSQQYPHGQLNNNNDRMTDSNLQPHEHE